MFIQVKEVLSDEGRSTRLRVNHCVQLSSGWRIVSEEDIVIGPKEYYIWAAFVPRGEKISAI
jgi:hypothetical protein